MEVARENIVTYVTKLSTKTTLQDVYCIGTHTIKELESCKSEYENIKYGHSWIS